MHFSGVAKNVYLGIPFDGSANCLFVLIFASILGMIDIYMHRNKLYDLFPHPSHPEPSFPVSLLTYCWYIPLVLKTSCPESILSIITPVLNPSSPESLLFYIPLFLIHPSFTASHLSCIPPLLQPTCQASHLSLYPSFPASYLY